MLKYFQELFVEPLTNNKLQYNGTFDNENWLNGVLQHQNEEVEYKVINGIPCFVDPKDDPWSDYDKLEEQLGESPEGVVEKNWLGMLQQDSFISKVQQLILTATTQDGLILEIGCGPCGGLTPLVLKNTPDAKILLNDYGFWILSETQNFIMKSNNWKNISMAQFDATKMPLCDNSISIIQSLGGFSNMKNSNQVLSECYRILKPKGKLCFVDAIIDKSQLENLPEDILKKAYSDYPYLELGFKDLLNSHHFKTVQIEVIERRQLQKNESGFAAEVSEYNVELDIELSAIIAEK